MTKVEWWKTYGKAICTFFDGFHKDIYEEQLDKLNTEETAGEQAGRQLSDCSSPCGGYMTPERFHHLQENPDEKLTKEELEEGYFFCCTWDYLLIHKNDPEAECCGCLKAETAGDGNPHPTNDDKGNK